MCDFQLGKTPLQLKGIILLSRHFRVLGNHNLALPITCSDRFPPSLREVMEERERERERERKKERERCNQSARDSCGFLGRIGFYAEGGLLPCYREWDYRMFCGHSFPVTNQLTPHPFCGRVALPVLSRLAGWWLVCRE